MAIAVLLTAEEEAKFQRHIEARVILISLTLTTRQIVNRIMRGKERLQDASHAPFSLNALVRAPWGKTTADDSKDDRLELSREVSIKGTIYEN